MFSYEEIVREIHIAVGKELINRVYLLLKEQNHLSKLIHDRFTSDTDRKTCVTSITANKDASNSELDNSYELGCKSQSFGEIQIVYSSEYGSTGSLANQLKQKLSQRIGQIPITINSITSTDKFYYPFLYIVMIPTCCDGDLPTDSRNLYHELSNLSTTNYVEDHVNVFIVGIGDSSYRNFALAGKLFYNALSKHSENIQLFTYDVSNPVDLTSILLININKLTFSDKLIQLASKIKQDNIAILLKHFTVTPINQFSSANQYYENLILDKSDRMYSKVIAINSLFNHGKLYHCVRIRTSQKIKILPFSNIELFVPNAIPPSILNCSCINNIIICDVKQRRIPVNVSILDYITYFIDLKSTITLSDLKLSDSMISHYINKKHFNTTENYTVYEFLNILCQDSAISKEKLFEILVQLPFCKGRSYSIASPICLTPLGTEFELIVRNINTESYKGLVSSFLLNCQSCNFTMNESKGGNLLKLNSKHSANSSKVFLQITSSSFAIENTKNKTIWITAGTGSAYVRSIYLQKVQFKKKFNKDQKCYSDSAFIVLFSTQEQFNFFFPEFEIFNNVFKRFYACFTASGEVWEFGRNEQTISVLPIQGLIRSAKLVMIIKHATDRIKVEDYDTVCICGSKTVGTIVLQQLERYKIKNIISEFW